MNSSKPKLCVITTGGTIGMVRDAEGIARPPADEADFERMLSPLLDRYEIGVVNFPSQDSTDMTPADWGAIRIAIHEAQAMQPDGIVITHGTDTLAHAAATLAFSLGPPPLPQPVVFTGAQRTPEDEGYDGADNLAAACAVAASELGEVAVVFHGRILRGCRVEKISLDHLDAFASPEPHGLGRVQADGRVGLHDDAARRGQHRETLPWPAESSIEDAVLSVALTPGLDPAPYIELIEQADTFRAVILHGFGAGHVPSREHYDWTALIRRATALDKPVLLSAPLMSGRSKASDYAAGRSAVEAGAIVAADLVQPAAEIKFRQLVSAAYHQPGPNLDFVREHIARSHFGEAGRFDLL